MTTKNGFSVIKYGFTKILLTPKIPLLKLQSAFLFLYRGGIKYFQCAKELQRSPSVHGKQTVSKNCNVMCFIAPNLAKNHRVVQSSRSFRLSLMNTSLQQSQGTKISPEADQQVHFCCGFKFDFFRISQFNGIRVHSLTNTYKFEANNFKCDEFRETPTGATDDRHCLRFTGSYC